MPDHVYVYRLVVNKSIEVRLHMHDQQRKIDALATVVNDQTVSEKLYKGGEAQAKQAAGQLAWGNATKILLGHDDPEMDMYGGNDEEFELEDYIPREMQMVAPSDASDDSMMHEATDEEEESSF
jgi:hypothetical protein